MSYKVLKHRKDNNESDLVQIAEKLGWRMFKLNEYADFLGLRNGQFHVIEIKNPDCEGDADEYTPAQKIFHTDVKNCGGKILVWRWPEDCVRDSNAMVSRGTR